MFARKGIIKNRGKKLENALKIVGQHENAPEHPECKQEAAVLSLIMETIEHTDLSNLIIKKEK